MSKIKNVLLPLVSFVSWIAAQAGELGIRYRVGHPRSYQFNASRGFFGIVNGDVLTKKGEAFSFAPVAYRIFRDDILNLGTKTWAEFFFINEAGHMCSILFHGYSVQNLNLITNDLFYDNVDLCEIMLTVTPAERQTKNGDKYFIAEFEYEILSEEERAAKDEIIKDLSIYREGTLTGDVSMELSKNFKPSVQLINGSGTAEAGVQVVEEAEAKGDNEKELEGAKHTESEKTVSST